MMSRKYLLLGLLFGLCCACIADENYVQRVQNSASGNWVEYRIFPHENDLGLITKKGYFVRIFQSSPASDANFIWLGMRFGRLHHPDGKRLPELTVIENRDVHVLYHPQRLVIDKKVRENEGRFPLVSEAAMTLDKVNLFDWLSIIMETLPRVSRNMLQPVTEDLTTRLPGIPSLGYAHVTILQTRPEIKGGGLLFSDCTQFLAVHRLLPGGRPDLDSRGLTWWYCRGGNPTFKILEINRLIKTRFIKHSNLASALSAKAILSVRVGTGAAM